MLVSLFAHRQKRPRQIGEALMKWAYESMLLPGPSPEEARSKCEHSELHVHPTLGVRWMPKAAWFSCVLCFTTRVFLYHSHVTLHIRGRTPKYLWCAKGYDESKLWVLRTVSESISHQFAHSPSTKHASIPYHMPSAHPKMQFAHTPLIASKLLESLLIFPFQPKPPPTWHIFPITA